MLRGSLDSLFEDSSCDRGRRFRLVMQTSSVVAYIRLSVEFVYLARDCGRFFLTGDRLGAGVESPGAITPRCWWSTEFASA